MICYFAYGSIINQTYSSNYGAGLEGCEFQETGLDLPVSLSRLSSRLNPHQTCVTAVPNPQGIPVPLYYADAQTSLEEAKNRLQKREGMLSQKNICVIPRTGKVESASIDQKTVKKIQAWLKKNSFQFGIMTAFPSTKLPLPLSPGIRERSLAYFQDLPPETQVRLLPRAMELNYFEPSPPPKKRFILIDFLMRR